MEIVLRVKLFCIIGQSVNLNGTTRLIIPPHRGNFNQGLSLQHIEMMPDGHVSQPNRFSQLIDRGLTMPS
jgi:hypothetical protein